MLQKLPPKPSTKLIPFRGPKYFQGCKSPMTSQPCSQQPAHRPHLGAPDQVTEWQTCMPSCFQGLRPDCLKMPGCTTYPESPCFQGARRRPATWDTLFQGVWRCPEAPLFLRQPFSRGLWLDAVRRPQTYVRSPFVKGYILKMPGGTAFPETLFQMFEDARRHNLSWEPLFQRVCKAPEDGLQPETPHGNSDSSGCFPCQTWKTK